MHDYLFRPVLLLRVSANYHEAAGDTGASIFGKEGLHMLLIQIECRFALTVGIVFQQRFQLVVQHAATTVNALGSLGPIALGSGAS